MFTGLIESLGKVASIKRLGNNLELEISSELKCDIGSSVSVDGVCLTVTKENKNSLIFNVMPTSIKDTALSFLKIGDIVNLERAMKADSRFDGHIVSGHIDTISRILKINRSISGVHFHIELKNDFRNYVIKKGSVAISGISLTVQETYSNEFRVDIIPHTLLSTSLSYKKAGDFVNVEFDMLVKNSINSKKINKINQEWVRNLGY